MTKVKRVVTEKFAQAYLELSLDDRNNFIRSLSKDKKHWSRMLDMAGLLAGFRADTLRDKYTNDHKRIDEALLMPKRGFCHLPSLVATYLCTISPEWLTQIRQHKFAEHLPDEVNDILAQAAATDKWANVVLALKDYKEALKTLQDNPDKTGINTKSGLQPSDQEWKMLDKRNRDCLEQVTTDNKEITLSREWLDKLNELGARAQEITDAASIGKEFALNEATEVFRSLQAVGSKLRHYLDELSARHKHEMTGWHNLEELQSLKRDLEELESQRYENDIARNLLKSIADVLRNIKGIKVRLRARRDELMAEAQQAVQELDEASALKTPPVLLNAAENGEEWLRKAYELQDDDLDELIESLESMALRALGRLLGHVSWDQLEFGNSDVEKDAGKTTADLDSKTVESYLPEAVAEEETGAEEKQSTSLTPVPDSVQEIKREAQRAEDERQPADTTEETCTDVEEDVTETITAKEAAEQEPTDVVESAPQSEKPAEAKRIDDTANIEISLVLIEDKQQVCNTLEKLTRRGLWHLAAEYVRVTQPEMENLPVEVFSLLALQEQVKLADKGHPRRIVDSLEALSTAKSACSIEHVLLWWSACVVPALGMSSLGVANSILHNLPDNELPEELVTVSQAILTLSGNVQNLSIDALRGGGTQADWESKIACIREKTEALRKNFLQQTFIYKPATEIWHSLVRNGEIAKISNMIFKGSSANCNELKNLLNTHFVTKRKFQKLVDKTDKEINSRPKNIETRVTNNMFDRAQHFVQLANQWIALQQVEIKGDYITTHVMQLRRELDKALPGVEDAVQDLMSEHQLAMASVINLATKRAVKNLQILLATSQNGDLASDPDIEKTIAAELLLVPELVFDDSWKIMGDAPETRLHIEKFSDEKISAREILDARLMNGDIRGARVLVDYNDELQVSDELETFYDKIESNLRAHRETTNDWLLRLRRDVSAVRSMGGVGEIEVAGIDEKLVRIERDESESERFDILSIEIQGLQNQLETIRNKQQEDLRAGLAQFKNTKPTATIRRITELIDQGDLLTAREYIGRVQSGHDLEDLENKVRDILAEFFPKGAKIIGERLEISHNGLLASLNRRSSEFAGIRLDNVPGAQRESAKLMLEAWFRIKQAPQRQFDVEDLRSLMLHLGFQVLKAGQQTDVRDGCKIEILCEPIEDREICPVPRFGSACKGRYDVYLFWDRPSEESVLHILGDRAASQWAGIVMWLGRLPEMRRFALSHLCRERLRSFILLDETMLAFLCGERGSRLPTFFRCSLPFTYTDPFVTAASLVPPEMFFGREKELFDLQDMNSGSCFVYGGRQLGKTALLREAQRRFHRPAENRFSLWLDLLTLGVGTEKRPEDIFKELDAEFKKLDIPGFDKKYSEKYRTSRKDTPFEKRVQTWLDSNTDGRILLLLDEADRFLEQDAESDYTQARKLKGLMDATHRRFKVVLAGLHNVQRTTRQSNHPLAHFGNPINVGAFSVNGDWGEAMRLVTEPFKAMGYRFESADLVMQILAVCNFYPGLIQDFCCRLLRLLNDKHLHGPPFEIDANMVDQVKRDPDFKHFVESRFQLTLQLDPRYHVIAYRLALQFHEDRNKRESGSSIADLQKAVAEFWAEGFHGMSIDDFSVLLEEMCGLGVLLGCGKGYYKLRNPNLLLLLGDRSRIEDHLLSGPRKRPEYRPNTFHIKCEKTSEPNRHPLTVTQEDQIVNPDNPVLILLGSDVLEMNNVDRVLRGRNFQNVRIHPLDTAELMTNFADQMSTLFDNVEGPGSTLFLYPPNGTWKASMYQDSVTLISNRKKSQRVVRVLFCVTPEEWWRTLVKQVSHGDTLHMAKISMTKWHPDFIQHWLEECGVPIDSEEDVEEILKTTGCWPKWLYKFVDSFSSLRNMEKTREEIALWLGNSANAAERLAVYGFGPDATRHSAFEILKGIRSLQSSADEPIHADETVVYAETLNMKPELIEAAIEWARTFGLLDLTKPDEWIWDPVFVSELES